MFVYVITGGRRHVKIGHSKDVNNRLKGIQTGCPFTVRIAGQWQSTRAIQIEHQAHRLLGKYRWAGEWFDVPAKAATILVGMLVASHVSARAFPTSKAIAFCRGCSHAAMLSDIPPLDARFRCSKCHDRERIHIVDFPIMESA